MSNKLDRYDENRRKMLLDELKEDTKKEKKEENSANVEKLYVTILISLFVFFTIVIIYQLIARFGK